MQAMYIESPGMRALQDAQSGDSGAKSEPTLVTVVTTAEELKGAIEQGLEHIEIRRHLDLRALSAGSDGASLLGDIPASLTSLQVRALRRCEVHTSIHHIAEQLRA